MELHHDKHHASYVNNLNNALEKFPKLQEHSATWLLLNLDQVPDTIRTAVHNNAGGHINHSLYWHAMSPTGLDKPEGTLAEAINHDFGSFEDFKKKFSEAGAKVFGSGWVWLAREQDKGGHLVITTTSGHDNPLMQGLFPIMLNDVWEHAYYLKYQNRRPEFLDSWWAVVNWKEAERRFEHAGEGIDQEQEERDELAHME
jgi:Fe-Mn family superoxide dismutase